MDLDIDDPITFTDYTDYNNNQHVDIRKFNMPQFCAKANGTSVAIIGGPTSGKTTLALDLLHNLRVRGKPFGLVCDPDSPVQPKYVYSHRDVQIFNTIVNRHPHALLVLDTCFCDTCFRNIDIVKPVGWCVCGRFVKTRTIKLNVLSVIDHCVDLPAQYGNNVDLVFIFRETITSNLRWVYDAYATFIPSFEFFCKLMFHMTYGEYECLVIDRKSTTELATTVWYDRLYWYKAHLHDWHKLRSEKMRDVHTELVATVISMHDRM